MFGSPYVGAIVMPPNVRALLLALLLLPSAAAAERVVTRSGEVVIGEPRFEGDSVVVRRKDGKEIRIPRAQVERIELTEEEVAPPPPPRQRAAPEEPSRPPSPPPYPTYRPPPPPPTPPGMGRRMLEHAAEKSGLLASFGYHRGLGVGLEWQQRLGARVGLGLGAQGGVAFNSEVGCFTYGFTGRLYVGRDHRLVVEGGMGLNRIDPYVNDREFVLEGPTCENAEKNFGPEGSLGYQYVSRQGLTFEILGGVAGITNDFIADERENIAGTFQLSLGYLFH